jgi:hypothetical protein
MEGQRLSKIAHANYFGVNGRRHTLPRNNNVFCRVSQYVPQNDLCDTARKITKENDR